MKKINAKELVNIVAGKLDLEVDCKNFKEFRTFINDVYTQFTNRWASLDDQAYYWHDVNVPERIVLIPTEVLQKVFKDADEKFNLEDAELYNADGDYDVEPETDLNNIEGEMVEMNYVDSEGTSIEDFLNFWCDVSKQYNCEIKVYIGNCDGNSYCNHDMKWTITADGINAENSYFEIEDDTAEKLMDALYWLTENFIDDTFEAFEKMGVELRYVESK